MKTKTLQIGHLKTERLILVPFTKQICENILNSDFSDLIKLGFYKGKSWPDEDVIETLPKIIDNLSPLEAPTGFESWMIIKADTLEIIGDAGFKGFNDDEKNADIGYGIIQEERKKGYAEEAVKGLIKWAFSQETVKEITANCAHDNQNSINLLNKLNFTKEKQDNEMLHWSLQNPSYNLIKK